MKFGEYVVSQFYIKSSRLAQFRFPIADIQVLLRIFIDTPCNLACVFVTCAKAKKNHVLSVAVW